MGPGEWSGVKCSALDKQQLGAGGMDEGKVVLGFLLSADQLASEVIQSEMRVFSGLAPLKMQLPLSPSPELVLAFARDA